MALWGRKKDVEVPAQRAEIGNSTTRPVIENAEDATNFLKALSHEGRLTILCHLLDGPRSVTELENLLASRQAAVSQQLARLRLEGLVNARRDGHQIYYSLRDPRVAEILALMSGFYEPGRAPIALGDSDPS
jgi:DNA-binding transcriptional ArsR family regulator